MSIRMTEYLPPASAPLPLSQGTAQPPLSAHHGGDPHVEGGLLLLRLQPLALARLPDQPQRLHVVPAVISHVTIY